MKKYSELTKEEILIFSSLINYLTTLNRIVKKDIIDNDTNGVTVTIKNKKTKEVKNLRFSIEGPIIRVILDKKPIYGTIAKTDEFLVCKGLFEHLDETFLTSITELTLKLLINEK